ncbi:hypothetical protein DPPLL_10540 [Desulfofustis limnaeus]|uniref:Uncharacterized protein n=1 Tax=Desulfofustis limnaeus TaxID=2740163 RepID=A0ABM7W6W2_9BACT|nr:hypothetical protein DPPLL_10540 [Desulfofustis limnaeus]
MLRPQQLLGVGGRAVAPFRLDLGMTVEQVVEDVQSLVGHADLVQIGENERPVEEIIAGVRRYTVVLAAQVTARAADKGQNSGIGHGYRGE